MQVQIAGDALDGVADVCGAAGDHGDRPKNVHTLIFRQFDAELRIVEYPGRVVEQRGNVAVDQERAIIALLFGWNVVAGQQGARITAPDTYQLVKSPTGWSP
jgi:hypothetical protein